MTINRNAARQLVTPNLSKNSFDLSNFWRGTTRMGTVTPVRWDDVTANSNWRIRTNFRAKFAPVVFPFDHRVDIQYMTGFIPYRLMMPNAGSAHTSWENWIMGDPKSRHVEDLLPWTTIDDANKANWYRGTVNNHLGLPPLDGLTIHADGEIDINVLPNLAYAMLYDEFLRNPWVQERRCGVGATYEIDLYAKDYTGGGAPLASLSQNQQANYDADYFMGALPEAYSGASTDVELDLDVYGTDGVVYWEETSSLNVPDAGDAQFDGADRRLRSAAGDTLKFRNGVAAGLESTLEILELRRSQALTRFLEAENRSGEENYDDWLKVMFGHDVNFEYARPTYLGGGRQAINVTEVLSTAETYDYATNDLTDQQTLNPQGSQVGHAMVSSGGETINFFAREPGIIMTVLVVKPKPAYMGGIEKFWLKDDRTEFFNHHFQGIGDQAILNTERGYDCTAGADNTGEWAYSTRWEEYKQKYDFITGDYQINGLDGWHLGKLHDMDEAPTFNELELQITPDDDENIRIFADQTGTYDEIWLQVYNDVQVVLPMHKIDIPK